MDEDLESFTRHQLVAETERLRAGIRAHRDSTAHGLCWHHPRLWGLLPERTDPQPAVPDWPQFLRGCIRYRQSLDEQLPHAQRLAGEFEDQKGRDHHDTEGGSSGTADTHTSSYPFVLVDVFTETPLTGNPLAVVRGADGLDAEQMQAIAREFNLSETTFVMQPRFLEATRRLRSFSPTAEVFGAGHNALGAWWAVIARGDVPLPEGETTLWQELGERVLPVQATYVAGRLRRIAMTQAPPHVGPAPPSLDALARALSLDVAALEIEGLEPQVISTGASHLLVPTRGLADLARVHVDARELAALAKPLGCQGCYLFCLETREPSAVAHARAFFPGIGIDEDPATGSAAGPLAQYLVARQRAPAGAWLTIEQGDQIRRPSRIEVRVSGDRVEVAGRCAVVAEGTLRL